VELTNRNRFVADGHARWSAAREGKIRAGIRENEPVGFFGKIQRWFKTEAAVWADRKRTKNLYRKFSGDFSSPRRRETPCSLPL
jgi:hypothetical protein